MDGQQIRRPTVASSAVVGPFDGTVDGDFVRQFAAATNDPSPRVRAGDVVPPLALAARLWQAQEASRAHLIPLDFQEAATGGVHGEHDLLLHRAIVPGEPLRTFVERFGARPSGRNSIVTLRYSTLDADDRVVADQWWTTVWLGVTCAAEGGRLPGQSLPRDNVDKTWSVAVDEHMAHRYAEVSGDWSPHHFQGERPFLHGLCVLALCAQGYAPGRLRRIGARFASPTFLGERLTVTLYDGGAFEATSGGVTVITHGRADAGAS